MTTPRTIRRSFVPFDVMTDDDQIAHLVSVHGFDEDYGYTGPGPIFPDLTDRADVVALFGTWTRNAREQYHADDHDPAGDEPAFSCLHTHDKP